jgi:hypothetical protein
MCTVSQDVRRMNVALTRARRALWVIGHADALSTNPDWCAFVRFAKESKAYVSVEAIGDIFGDADGAAAPAAASESAAEWMSQRGPRPPEPPPDALYQVFKPRYT